MRETLQEIVSLQKEYSASKTPAMERRGMLVRHILPAEIESLGALLRTAMGPSGDDAKVQGKDNMGQMARIPWVRWHSRSRSPSATTGWYVVYLFHPDGSGVSLCLSHGSTKIDGSAFVNRTEAEATELMTWAWRIVGPALDSDGAVQRGVALGTFGLAIGYQRTTAFSKFYPDGDILADADLEADLARFVRALAKLYDAQDRGIEPGTPGPDLLAFHETVQGFAAPLRAPGRGQGRGLSATERKAVEHAAMARAKEWLEEQGFEFRDVSMRDSCDFRARRHGQEWVIEVKGTTGGPGSVLLTRNEVNLHRASFPRNALLVVHGLTLSDDGLGATGGELVAFCPWQLEEERLSSICYEYRLSR